MNYVDRAERDIKNGCISYNGLIGLLKNFSCYTRTYTYDTPKNLTKEQFEWCEKNFGDHKTRWMFIPNIIEKDYVYWFFSNEKEKTIFQLRWKTI